MAGTSGPGKSFAVVRHMAAAAQIIVEHGRRRSHNNMQPFLALHFIINTWDHEILSNSIRETFWHIEVYSAEL